MHAVQIMQANNKYYKVQIIKYKPTYSFMHMKSMQYKVAVYL